MVVYIAMISLAKKKKKETKAIHFPLKRSNTFMEINSTQPNQTTPLTLSLDFFFLFCLIKKFPILSKMTQISLSVVIYLQAWLVHILSFHCSPWHTARDFHVCFENEQNVTIIKHICHVFRATKSLSLFDEVHDFANFKVWRKCFDLTWQMII